MPGDAHEGYLDLLQESPQLMTEVLADLGHPDLVAGLLRFELGSERLTVRSLELRPDAVWLLHGESALRLAVVVEVQRRIDTRKLSAWPIYEWVARKAHGCPALVLVVTPDQRVEAWASQPLLTPTGGSFRPLVLGPTAGQRAIARLPTLSPAHSVLTAMLLSRGDSETAIAAAKAAVDAARSGTEEQVRLYLDLIDTSLRELHGARWELEMALPGYRWKSDFALKHRAEGREEGREEGRLNGAREVLGEQLAARFGGLPEWAGARLEKASFEELRAWSVRLVTAEQLEDLFTPPGA